MAPDLGCLIPPGRYAASTVIITWRWRSGNVRSRRLDRFRHRRSRRRANPATTLERAVTGRMALPCGDQEAKRHLAVET